MLLEQGPRPDDNGLYNLSALMHSPVLVDHKAHALQRTIAFGAIRSRGVGGLRQYGRYFASFWAWGLLEPDRADLLRSSYFWLRHVDDIADQDKPLPPSYRTRADFLLQKRNLVEKLNTQSEPAYGDREDILLVHYFLLAQRLGIDLGQESLAILDTIIFDEERARTRSIPTQQELDEYFRKLDFACGDGALKVAGESGMSSESLPELSMAVRIMFNLRDFPKDFARGIVNIAAEDLEKYGIDLAKCKGKTIEGLLMYGPLRRWYQDQVTNGFTFFNRAKDVLVTLPLKRVTRLGLAVSFERPVETTLGRYQRLLQGA